MIVNFEIYIDILYIQSSGKSLLISILSSEFPTPIPKKDCRNSTFLN